MSKRTIPSISKSFASRPGASLPLQADEKGKVRVKEHVVGDWPTHVYINVPPGEALQRIQGRLAGKGAFDPEQCHPMWGTGCSLHLSLSKTVYPNFHHLRLLSERLTAALSDFPSVSVGFDRRLEKYANAGKTRFFLSLDCTADSNRALKAITDAIDRVFREFGFEAFYEAPRFHASLLWSPTDCFSDEALVRLNGDLATIKDADWPHFQADQIIVRMGNRDLPIKLR